MRITSHGDPGEPLSGSLVPFPMPGDFAVIGPDDQIALEAMDWKAYPQTYPPTHVVFSEDKKRLWMQRWQDPSRSETVQKLLPPGPFAVEAQGVLKDEGGAYTMDTGEDVSRLGDRVIVLDCEGGAYITREMIQRWREENSMLWINSTDFLPSPDHPYYGAIKQSIDRVETVQWKGLQQQALEESRRQRENGIGQRPPTNQPPSPKRLKEDEED